MEIWSISVSLRSQNKFRLQWVNFLPLIHFTHSQKTKGHYTTGGLGLRANLGHLQEVVLHLPTGLIRLPWKPQPPSGFLDSVALRLYCVWNIPGGFSFCWKTLTRRSGGLPHSACTATMQIATWHMLDLAVNTLPPPPPVSVTSPDNSCSTEMSFFVREGLLSTDRPLRSWEWLWISHSLAFTFQVGGLQVFTTMRSLCSECQVPT